MRSASNDVLGMPGSPRGRDTAQSPGEGCPSMPVKVESVWRYLGCKSLGNRLFLRCSSNVSVPMMPLAAPGSTMRPTRCLPRTE
eukprot:7569110-Lingulodinium_polyedra.AAC.1